jgi:tRNA-2-methylthio-N6-dimethylallyladenosine synthase
MKYYIVTYGCQMNKSDSERIASALNKIGYKQISKSNEADLIVVNMCSVRQSAVDRVYAKINKHHKIKKIILAGCILKKDKENLKNKVAEFWHPDKYFACSPKYQSKISVFLPIMTGCNNFCAYCIVPYARGREKSRPAKEIIKEFKSLVKKGYKEIVLLGQNVDSYISEQKVKNSEQPINFSKLLAMINDIPGDFRLNFLTSHPKDMSDELIETMTQCEKLIPYLHLPVQSGDNQILKKMNRHYTAAHYKNLIKKVRGKIPGIKISTDIIVGFPGETEKQFQNTVKLCRKIKFNKAYINKYSARPGTAAAKLKDNVLPQDKKRRWKFLDKLINKKHAAENI